MGDLSPKTRALATKMANEYEGIQARRDVASTDDGKSNGGRAYVMSGQPVTASVSGVQSILHSVNTSDTVPSDANAHKVVGK